MNMKRLGIVALGLVAGVLAGMFVTLSQRVPASERDAAISVPHRGAEVAWWEAVKEERAGSVRTIRVPADVLFPVDSARIDESGTAVLRSLAPSLRQASRIEIAGATDSTGSRARNVELSRLRAESAKDVLVAAGVPAGSIVTIAWADDHPLADENGPDRAEARARNRRIEIQATMQEVR